MEEYKCCEVCGKPYSELHHIIFRSQAKYMANVPVNFMYLCSTHHRGVNSPHLNREIDLEYKQQLQTKLINLFHKEYYNIHQIRTLLGISKGEAEKITNKLMIYKEGYKSEDIIKKMLGGRMY